MTDSPAAPSGGANAGEGGTPDSVVLSTGQTVHLPLELSATVTGGAFTASLGGVRELLPEGLAPVRVAPDRGAVVVLSVAYDAVGVDGLDPYDEVGVIVPAAEGRGLSASRRSAFTSPGGYVWHLPVTTEPACALGVDVWGYPKTVAEIDHESVDGRRRTTLREDGDHVLTLTVDRPRTVGTSLSASSYTVHEGRLLREPVSLFGRVGVWPLTRGATLELGDHWRADRLRSLSIGGRALARLYADVEGRIGPGVPVVADEG